METITQRVQNGAKSQLPPEVFSLLSQHLSDLVESSVEFKNTPMWEESHSTGQQLQNPPPSQEQETQYQMQQVRQGGAGGAVTFKISNAKLKLGKLAAFGATTSLTLAGVGWNPVMFIVAMVTIVAGAINLAKTPINENEASVIWAATKSEIAVTEEVLRHRTDEERRVYGLPSLSEQQFRGALKNLVRLGCLEPTSVFSYRLAEEVSFSQCEDE